MSRLSLVDNNKKYIVDPWACGVEWEWIRSPSHFMQIQGTDLSLCLVINNLKGLRWVEAKLQPGEDRECCVLLFPVHLSSFTSQPLGHRPAAHKCLWNERIREYVWGQKLLRDWVEYILIPKVIYRFIFLFSSICDISFSLLFVFFVQRREEK